MCTLSLIPSVKYNTVSIVIELRQDIYLKDIQVGKEEFNLTISHGIILYLLNTKGSTSKLIDIVVCTIIGRLQIYAKYHGIPIYKQ